MAPDRTAQALGDVQGTLRSLERTVSDLTEQWRRQDEAATTGRMALYNKFDNLSHQVTGAIVTLNSVKGEVDDIQINIRTNIMPTIHAYNLATARRDGRRAGIFLMGNLTWAVILSVATIIGFAIHEAVQYFTYGTGPFFR